MPTPDQISKVRQNLVNLNNLNDSIHDSGQDKMNILMLYFTDKGKGDPTQAIMSNLLGTAFGVLSTVTGQPEFKAVGTVLSGLYSLFATKTPPSLNQPFADIWERYYANYTAAAASYANYNVNTEEYWNEKFKNPITSEEITLGELADLYIPAKLTPDFESAREASVNSMILGFWKYIAPLGCHIKYQPQPNFYKLDDSGVKKYIASYVQKNQNSYLYYVASHQNKVDGYEVYYNELFLGNSEANDNFCQTLIIDDGVGDILNPSALAYREDVFSSWQIPRQSVLIKGGKENLSTLEKEKNHNFKRATSGANRLKFNQRILEKCEQDLSFRIALQRNPSLALKAYFGEEIPKNINVKVFFEDSKHYIFVLPNSLNHLEFYIQKNEIKLPSGEIHKILQERMNRTELEYYISIQAMQNLDLLYSLLTDFKNTLRSEYNIRVPEEVEFEIIEEGSEEYIIVIPYGV